MKKIIPFFLLFFAAVFLVIPATSQCGTNILTNPGFDAPLQPAIGNNLLGTTNFNGWTMTGGPFNVVRTNGSVYGGGPDNAQNGTQYIDITSAGGTIFQDFTISGATLPVGYSGHFSSREQSGYVDWTASIQIINLSTSAVVSTSNTRLFTIADGAVPAQETWHYLFGNVTLPPGNYRYLVNLGNHGNFDAAQLSTNCVLAATLTKFTAAYNAGNTTLNWTTTNEINLAAFDVEHSTDGRTFNKIGNVLFAGNHEHTYTDKQSAAAPVMYYRIKLIDKDGRFKYTDIISVKTKGTLVLQVWPNPVQNSLLINGLTGKGDIKIYDATGRLIQQQTIAAIQSTTVNVAALKKGSYVVAYNNGKKNQAQRFVKQ